MVEKYQCRSFSAFGNGITSLITAYLYFILFSAYKANYLTCTLLFAFLYLNLILYLYISIKVIFNKQGIMQYFNIGNQTIVTILVLLGIYFICIKNINALKNPFILSFSELNNNLKMGDVLPKFIPICVIKLLTDFIYNRTEEKYRKKAQQCKT